MPHVEYLYKINTHIQQTKKNSDYIRRNLLYVYLCSYLGSLPVILQDVSRSILSFSLQFFYTICQ